MDHSFAGSLLRAVMAIRFSVICLAMLIISQAVFAQPVPPVLWTQAVGGPGVDAARAIRQTPDGGYLVAGYAHGTGGEAGMAAVIKFDSAGSVVWSRTYGEEGYYSWLFGLDLAPSGGFAVVGLTMTPNDSYDAWVIRADDNGNPIWSRTFGGWMNDQGYAITATSDGGFAVAGLDATLGSGRYLAYLVKLSADGELLWQQAWGVESVNVEARSVRECPDGGFIIVGGSVSYGEWNAPFNMFVVRTNARGRALWTRQYGGTGNEFASDVVCLDDGGFAIAGYTTSRGRGQRDMCLLRIDARGRRHSMRVYGGMGDDAAFALRRTTDGGFLLAGYTSSFGQGDKDLCLIKTNGTGARLWRQTYGTPGCEFPWSNQCVELTSDGGYALAGTTTSTQSGEYDMYVVKTGPDQPPSLLAPAEFDYNEVYDDPDELPDVPAIDESVTVPVNYPNPFNPSTTISYNIPESGFVTLRVYNLLGQHVATLVNGSVEAGHYTVMFDGSQLPSGVYVYKLETPAFSTQNKMLLMK